MEIPSFGKLLAKFQCSSNFSNFCMIYPFVILLGFLQVYIGWELSWNEGNYASRDAWQFVLGVGAVWLVFLHTIVLAIGMLFAFTLDRFWQRKITNRSKLLLILILLIPSGVSSTVLVPATIQPAIEKFCH